MQSGSGELPLSGPKQEACHPLCRNRPIILTLPFQRGIPIGFINRLESRLAETEEALFRVLQLAETPSTANSLAPLPPSHQSRPERINEWDRLPLQTLDDIKRWYQLKSGSSWLGESGFMQSSHDTPSSGLGSDLDPLTSQTRQADEGEPPTQLRATPRTLGRIRPLEGLTPTIVSPTAGRAKELGKSMPDLYF